MRRAPVQARPSGGPLGGGRYEGARILVTDDRPEVLRLIERALADRFACEFAGSVGEARGKLATDGPFALALCDIEMPGESGLVLVEEIARDHPEMAIVLVTGVDDLEVARRAFEIGAHGYLIKPFWPGQLLITAMNALRRRELEIAQRAHSEALEDRLQTLMDRAPVAIYMKDRERRFIVANALAHQIAGLEPNQMIGLHSSEVLPAETDRVVAKAEEAILGGGGTYEGEETVEVEGEPRTFLTVKFPFAGDDGEIAGIYGISTDITDKKRAEMLAARLAREQERAIEDLWVSRQETVELLAKALEMHDGETGRHVNRMSLIAGMLAEAIGLDRDRVLLLHTAAPMHDVGKVATPDAILQKSGPLRDEERKEMERHTIVGYKILSDSDSELLQLAATIALTHHERWDGGGYPYGLAGEEIPIEGRIAAVADVFDALLSDRCYRSALSVEDAVEVMRDGRGTHFDPALVDALLGNLEEALSLRG